MRFDFLDAPKPVEFVRCRTYWKVCRRPVSNRNTAARHPAFHKNRTKEKQSRRSNNRQFPTNHHNRQTRTDLVGEKDFPHIFEKMSLEKEMGEESPKDVAAEAAAAAAAASVAEDNGERPMTHFRLYSVHYLLTLTIDVSRMQKQVP
jgi:hypothetical protein